ncbi:MAG: FAS1-like dehydratase domain-containing protein, partial [Gemmobacter sp.]
MTMLAEWTFAVEAGKIAEFARAVGGGASDAAPPTFTMVAGADWVERLVTEVLALDRGRTVHGEQAYDYVSPIKAGMVLRCRASLLSDVTKPGRAGPMRVVTVGIEHADAASGAVLVRETMTTLEQAAAVPGPPPPNTHPPRGGGGRQGPPRPGAGGVRP